MGIGFMEHDCACQHQIPHQELKERKQVEVNNGRPIESGDMTQTTKVGMNLLNQGEQVPIFITKPRHHPIVLGLHCLLLHDVAICFASNIVTFER